MIVEIKVRYCPKCGSDDIIRNGHDYKDAQKFHCKTCGAYGTLDKKGASAQAQRQQVMDAYFERVSMRDIERIFVQGLPHLQRFLGSLSEGVP
jgi:transposase-like protein